MTTIGSGEELMNKKRMIDVLNMITHDTADDVERFEGLPFTGKTVGEYLGCISASITALANIIKEILEQENNDGQ
jgi:hypothetical protein